MISSLRIAPIISRYFKALMCEVTCVIFHVHIIWFHKLTYLCWKDRKCAQLLQNEQGVDLSSAEILECCALWNELCPSTGNWYACDSAYEPCGTGTYQIFLSCDVRIESVFGHFTSVLKVLNDFWGVYFWSYFFVTWLNWIFL